MRASAVKIASSTRLSLSCASASAKAGTDPGWSVAVLAAAHRASADAAFNPSSEDLGSPVPVVFAGSLRIRGMGGNQLLQFFRDIRHGERPVRAAGLDQLSRHAPDDRRFFGLCYRSST